MTKYDGNILRWHEFWDQFSSIIENRQQMSDVDKLSYLSSLVEVDAKRANEGLDITNSNYKIALYRLTERFGKKGSLIVAHYTALQQIPKSTRDVTSFYLLARLGIIMTRDQYLYCFFHMFDSDFKLLGMFSFGSQ
uniref:Phospholipase D alpha 1 n=1 Tax=Lygus hesperus TaxID=30085 RepID=A0A0A9XSY4_LYGHE